MSARRMATRLLLSNGEVMNLGNRVEPEAVPPDHRGRLGCERPDARDPGRSLPADEKVLGDAEPRHQLVVLVHHPHPAAHRVLG